MLSILLSSLSFAELSDYVENISDPVVYETDGVWVRSFHTDTGWKLLAQQGEAYTVVDLYKDNDTWVRDDNVVRLTEGRDLQDSCIKRCPDGGYLLISSASISGFNDSAYAFRYDSDFNLLAERTIAESEPDYSFNDINCECSNFIVGATFGINSPTQYENYFFELNDDLTLSEPPFPISSVTRANGGATWTDLSTNRIIMSGFHMESQNIFLEFDPELNLLNETPTEMASNPWVDFWTQSFIRVGEVFFAATIVRSSVDPDAPYELMLIVLDEQWNILERHLVTNGGGSRPSLERNGDQILLTSDVNNSPQIIEITIGSGFNSEDPPPIGYNDFDNEEAGELDVKVNGCGGCSTGGQTPVQFFFILGLMVLRRSQCFNLPSKISSDAPIC